MEDWRIIKEQEVYWVDKKFLKMIFPSFWQHAYASKNRFFQYVLSEAKQQSTLLEQNKKNFDNDFCKKFWHRHCDFCTKSITIDANEICYCSEDGLDWICSECFHDFKQKFGWKVLDKIQDIPVGFTPLQVEKV